MGRYAQADNLLSQSARFWPDVDEAKKTLNDMEQAIRDKCYDISALAYPGFRLAITE